MAEIGEVVAAVVTEITPLSRVPGTQRCYGGTCTVECSWGSYVLVDGSIQGVHHEDRVVGTRGRLRWHGNGLSGYNGPVWVRGTGEEG